MENKKIRVKKSIEGKEVANVVCQAMQYQSRVILRKGESIFNLKSLMGLFALQLEPNTEIQLETDGADEVDALNHMAQIFE